MAFRSLYPSWTTPCLPFTPKSHSTTYTRACCDYRQCCPYIASGCWTRFQLRIA
ncbi:hypothetical protein THIOM_005470 [Candidatus Thiomargarita nelsonii]|uniref:Uncharacterized protein n=1 Tax=Candidatus Thiomargarita nelsonii TaxID=1003181 RepID=A0A176RT41_9GAMM|nr:hypothetical protein THIOM_005470 [Candidatus Thiomargarita nelsonii]